MPKTIRNTALFLAFVSMFVFTAFADRTNLRPAWNLFTPQQDIEIGRWLADEADRNFQFVEDHNANVYIDALGKQLAVHAANFRYPYQFKIVRDYDLNAWALPGGFIYVTSGLIDALQNEPQLAGVVAHEIAHVVLRQGSAAISQAYADRVGTTRGRVAVNDALSRLDIHFGNDSIPLKYSREEERQADVVATQLMWDAKFDPQQMTTAFQTIRNDSSHSTTFFSAHPYLSNLDAVVRTELRNLGGLPRNVRGDSPDFHSVKDRIQAENTGWPSIYDRDTGYRPDPPSNRMVLYRGRDIEFRYPDNWFVSDRGDSIDIAPDNGRVSGSLAWGMTIATFDPRGTNYFGLNSFTAPGSRIDTTTLANATSQLIDHLQQSNPNLRVVRNTERRHVNGEPAMVVELTNDSPIGGIERDWLVTVLRPNGMLRYFVGVAPQRDFNRYQPVFEQIVNNARLLD
jgi:Zn-dependent protease with chaperone function